ncbi:hypothetical protein Oweho_2399 [Owenweeksia hongkongensis DSM 17368]|uniref:Uncharacterized protein n=2 Tax=Owenweeksia TaxID=267986 RepID=G8R704_OWEHD|nr:hypothetical protein Oweho_2399 [Owenweeksia hongkongensis DSM 17368]
MQRWLFFIFCIMGSVLMAQPSDIVSIHLSIWKDGAFASANPNVIQASAEVTFKASKSPSQAVLLTKGLAVSNVELREGRIKGKLKWNQRNDSLFIQLRAGKRSTSTVKIDYQISLTDENNLAYIQKSEDVFALNAMNATTEMGMGIPGMWFPSASGDRFKMKLDITTKADENIGFSGSEEYKVKLPNGLLAHFWKSDKEILPEDFYLIIGTFNEYDAEELEEEFELSTIALKEMKYEKAKRKVMPYISLYGFTEGAISDSEYAIVDSLSAQDFSAYFLSKDDLPTILKEQYQIEAALAFYIENRDFKKASDRHWGAYSKLKGADWTNQIMLKKWKDRDSLTVEHYDKMLAYRVVNYQKSNPELMAEIPSQQLDTAFVKPLTQSRVLPMVSFSYRYVSGDTALYVKYVQDTAKSNVYAFPVRVIVRSGDLIDTAFKLVDQVSGELKITFPKVPNLAKVEVGDFFPGTLSDKRPDTYNLFQLSKAESEEEREEALIGLFKTSNPNLFSTALGIAMDDDQARLRALALDYADNLNAAGQQKLKDTIIALSENDSNAEVRKKAKILVKKYYGPK